MQKKNCLWIEHSLGSPVQLSQTAASHERPQLQGHDQSQHVLPPPRKNTALLDKQLALGHKRVAGHPARVEALSADSTHSVANSVADKADTAGMVVADTVAGAAVGDTAADTVAAVGIAAAVACAAPLLLEKWMVSGKR